ncbi:MAG: DNA repair protein RecO [Deltaproteobacteria bacterium]|nr:DNA repair protein RecO [Deltaproteobacteria bacterium]
MSDPGTGGAIRGVVTGAMDYREADRIVRLLSASHGRVSLLLRDARRSRRRFVGLGDVGNEVSVEVRPGRGELLLVTGGEVLRAPSRARDDLERLALLWYGAEVCSALAPEGQACERLPRLLEVWIDLLETLTPGSLARTALEAKALTFAGLAPSLVRCAACGERLTDPAVFGHGHGGAMHQGCGEGVRVEARHLLELEAARRTPLADLGAAEGYGGWLLSDFITYQLGRALLSRALLEEVAQPSPAR